jgi:hypothetical protein
MLAVRLAIHVPSTGRTPAVQYGALAMPLPPTGSTCGSTRTVLHTGSTRAVHWLYGRVQYAGSSTTFARPMTSVKMTQIAGEAQIETKSGVTAGGLRTTCDIHTETRKNIQTGT